MCGGCRGAGGGGSYGRPKVEIPLQRSPLQARSEVHFQPYSIATDSQSHILVSDCNIHCVHILDYAGEYLHHLGDCNLKYPIGLCFDKNDFLFELHSEQNQKILPVIEKMWTVFSFKLYIVLSEKRYNVFLFCTTNI